MRENNFIAASFVLTKINEIDEGIDGMFLQSLRLKITKKSFTNFFRRKIQKKVQKSLMIAHIFPLSQQIRLFFRILFLFRRKQ